MMRSFKNLEDSGYDQATNQPSLRSHKEETKMDCLPNSCVASNDCAHVEKRETKSISQFDPPPPLIL